MSATTVIIGAGASADFGFPLGGRMYDDAQELLSKLKAEWQVFRKNNHPAFNRCISWMKSHPHSHALLDFCIDEDEGRFSLAEVFRMLSIMEVSPALSLDTFALEHPEFSSVCQRLSALIICDAVKKLISLESDGSERRQYTQRRLDETASANWISLFVSMARNKRTADQNHTFKVVSFNYDMLFERAVREIWQTPSRDVGRYEDVFTTVYPHGKISWEIGTHGKSKISVNESSLQFARFRDSDGTDQEAFTALEESDVIITLGFNFAAENLATLGLADLSKDKLLIAQNYDNNPSLNTRVTRTGFREHRIFNGSIADAIMQGQLLELPA